MVVQPGRLFAAKSNKLNKHLAFNAKGGRSATSYTLSVKAIHLLEKIEQFRSAPYDDQTGKTINAWVKGATIGYGHLIKRIEWNKYVNGITQPQAETLFKNELSVYVNAVKNHIKSLITQNEFDALVILSYNIGAKAFIHSEVVKIINNPKTKTPYSNLEQAWKAWNKSQGKVNSGLIHRRQSEWNIYSKNIYKKW